MKTVQTHTIPELASHQLQPILRSHGWLQLQPFLQMDKGFQYAFLLDGNRPITIHIQPSGRSIVCHRDAKIPKKLQSKFEQHCTRILSLDFPMAAFRQVFKENEEPALLKLSQKGWGRMLHSATPWEDAVKTLCTTNAAWGNTISMVKNLVSISSTKTVSGHATFPSPDDVLRILKGPKATTLKLGYRADYLEDLAQRALNEDDWLLHPLPQLSEEDLLNRINQWRGFGPYATHHMMILLGHYNNLPIDSEVTHFFKTHMGIRGNKSMQQAFDDWGDFSFIAYKLHRVNIRLNQKS